MRRLAWPFVLLPTLALAACSEGYSPNTYASNAAQEEAAVQRGVIVGVRQVMISANGTIGTAAGGAAGGVAGAQTAGSPVATALGAIGGTLVGGIGGDAAAHAVADAKGWEYIVQEDGDKLVSVTQTSKTSLTVGLHVLVIAGSQQARIVPDYTVQIAPPPPPVAPVAASAGSATEINVVPFLPGADAATPLQLDPITGPTDPAAAPAPVSAASPPATQPAPPSAPGAATSTPPVTPKP